MQDVLFVSYQLPYSMTSDNTILIAVSHMHFKIISFNVQSWVRVATTGKIGVPTARRDQAIILLGTPQHPQLFMTGGIDRNWNPLGDAWILNLEREAEGRIIQGSWLKVK